MRRVHPRVRGDTCLGETHVAHRFTPAFAGTPCTRPFSTPTVTVHPRTCGVLGRPYCCEWFTPAFAGTPRHRPGSARPSRVHPRVCGDTSSVCAGRSSSPVHPRVSGDISSARVGRFSLPGFTPACAGTTTPLYPLLVDPGAPSPLSALNHIPSSRLVSRISVAVLDPQLRRFSGRLCSFANSSLFWASAAMR